MPYTRFDYISSRTHPEHKIFPYLLRGVAVVRPNQVWSTDITYVRLPRGNIRQARSRSVWERMFKTADLCVAEHRAHLSKTVIQIWDIGFRPLFPVLHRMANAIPAEDFLDIKREWTATMRQFLEPLIEMDGSLTQGKEPAFHCYILEK